MLYLLVRFHNLACNLPAVALPRDCSVLPRVVRSECLTKSPVTSAATWLNVPSFPQSISRVTIPTGSVATAIVYASVQSSDPSELVALMRIVPEPTTVGVPLMTRDDVLKVIPAGSAPTGA